MTLTINCQKIKWNFIKDFSMSLSIIELQKQYLQNRTCDDNFNMQFKIDINMLETQYSKIILNQYLN